MQNVFEGRGPCDREREEGGTLACIPSSEGEGGVFGRSSEREFPCRVSGTLGVGWYPGGGLFVSTYGSSMGEWGGGGGTRMVIPPALGDRVGF
jgi:hypothetical protein